MNAINRAVRRIVGASKPAVETAAATPIHFGETASDGWSTDARTIVRIYDAKYKNIGDATPYTKGRLIRNAGNGEYLVEVDGKQMLVKTTQIDNRSGYTALHGATMRPAETASNEEQQLDALRLQNGHRYMTSGERAKRVQACITNMTADQIRAKLAQVQGKPDPGAKDWVAVYTEALAKKG